MSEAKAEIVSIIAQLGLTADTTFEIEPLAGGVSSDIYRVSAPGKMFVVKRALPQLRVADEWRAPVERNQYEVEWLRIAAEVESTMVPTILGHDVSSGSFAMSYLAPDSHSVWKSELREGRIDCEFAALVGERIVRIHVATAGRTDVATRFATDHIFHTIRLEPYFEATARRHPALFGPLMALSRETLTTKRALVHGDISPKNIMVGPAGPIFLDAECAWYGDPAFDLAFCLNHLLLKALWNRSATYQFLEAFEALKAVYLKQVTWERPDELEARAARLLPALFLARVDGKSPVEYITREDEREHVRRTAIPLIKQPSRSLSDIKDAWGEELAKTSKGME